MKVPLCGRMGEIYNKILNIKLAVTRTYKESDGLCVHNCAFRRICLTNRWMDAQYFFIVGIQQVVVCLFIFCSVLVIFYMNFILRKVCSSPVNISVIKNLPKMKWSSKDLDSS